MRITKYTSYLDENKHCELVKEFGVNYPGEEKLDNPSKIAKMMREVFQVHRFPEEHLFLLCFDVKMRLLGILEMSIGTAQIATVPKREIFQKALLCNATSIVLVHNHPSGDATPSGVDFQSTKDIAKCGHLIGIPLLDHIVIAGDQYCSLREKDISLFAKN